LLHNKDIEALVALGLTVLQSKVYLALAKLDEAEVLALSKAINVARQEIQRGLIELENRALVEKVLDRPVRFRAVAIKEAVPHLLMKIHKEQAEADNHAMQLVERYSIKNVNAKLVEHEPLFYLISKKAALSRRIKKEIANARKTIDIMITGKNCVPALFDLSSSLADTLKRRVKVRWIVNRSVDLEAKPSFLETISKYPLFKLRCIPHKPTQTFGIYDKRMIIVASNPRVGYAQSPALCTNAVSLVELAQNHFNMLWNTATSEHSSS
jgi:sugar-specific transcriptional regulator TrmB